MTNSTDLYRSLSHQYGYVALIYSIFGLFVILAPLYVYMLLKVLPKQATMTYKWLLSSCCVSTITIGVLRAVWVPVPTLPLLGVYSAGIIGKLGPMANFSALRPFSWVSHLGSCPYRVAMCYASYFVFMAAVISFLLHFSVVDRSEYLEHALNTNNMYAVELITKQPSWIGFSAAIKPSVIAFAVFAVFPDFCVACFSVILTARIYFIIETGRSTVSTTTYNLEKNLYRAFLFRTVSLVGLHTIPSLGIVLAILFEFQSSKLGIILHALIIIQSAMCLIGTIIILKPFRHFIFGCFYRKVGDSSGSGPNSSGSAQTHSTLTATSKPLPPLRTRY